MVNISSRYLKVTMTLFLIHRFLFLLQEHDEASPETTVKIKIRGSEEGGSPWDDGVYSTVRSLVITHREWICSIHVEYDKNGESIWGSKRGGNEGSTSVVKLELP